MIGPAEREIRGRWSTAGGKVEEDANCQRIDQLVTSALREIARDSSGWDVLYIDPADGRHWELTYPESDLHGGGPPMLRFLTAEEARSKYGVA